MKIFIDDGETKFLLEESTTEDLKYNRPQRINKVIIITLEKEIENQIDKIENIRKLSENIINSFKGSEYKNQCIFSIKYDTLQKEKNLKEQ
jgi:hypothetical protein